MKLNRNVIVRTYNERTFPDNLKVGELVELFRHEYIGPSNCHHRNGESYYSMRYIEECIPSSDCTIDDWFNEDCGLREVLGITDIKRVIKGSNPDRIREWGWRIVLGKDISESK